MEFITRSYLKTLEGTPIHKEYPKYLEWDGQKAGMDYMGDILHFTSYIMENIYHNLEVREVITPEQALEYFLELQGYITEIYFNFISHTDGEEDFGKHLMEAWMVQEKEGINGETNLQALQQLYNKVVGEGE